MQTYKRTGTVIFVSNNGSPGAAVTQDIEAHGVVVECARSIRAAVDLVSLAREKTVIVTDLALVDGNWRDLVERVRCIDKPIQILLLSPSSTAELWWDALESGIDDILHGPVEVSRLCKLMGAQRENESSGTAP